MAQNNENDSSCIIPDELMLMILSKLPLKSLKRFSCVKKSWLHLFDNPHFMAMFRRNFISNCHYGNDTSLLLCQLGQEENEYQHKLIWISGERFGEKVNNIGQLQPPLSQRFLRLLGYGSGIHGVICISAPLDQKESPVLLWNPATHESLIIPPSPVNSDLPPFNSLSSNYAIVQCGFGYDHIEDDFKLIQCIQFRREQFNIWEIYSVRSNTWRKLDVNVPCPLSQLKREHAYLNGVCHWIGYVQKPWPWMAYPYPEKHLVSFNLNTELVLMTPYPVDKNDHRMDVILDVLNGYIASISNENNSICISILGEIGMEESWTKLFTFGPLPCNFKHLHGVGNKGDILYIKKEDHELASFDLSTQMIEEIDVKGEMHCSLIIIYKESLLPIRRINN